MADYEYLNTRVRSMKSKLMRRGELEQILELPDVTSMVDHLLEGLYAEDLAVALRAHPPVRAIETALGENMRTCLDRIKQFAGPSGTGLLVAATERWDARCLKTILRGLHRQLHTDEIVAFVEPGVQFTRNLVETLAIEPNVVDAVALLQSWSMPWGRILQPLLRGYRETGNLRPLEFALDQHRIDCADRMENVNKAGRRQIQEFLWAEAEVLNISTCLVHLDSEQKPELLNQGSRSMALVNSLLAATNYEEIVKLLSESPYRHILDRALPSLMADRGSYAVLERLLDEALLQQTARAALLDPLGVAVPFHYLRCKRNEVMNLRLIARGLDNGLPRNMVRLSLALAPEVAA